LPLTVTTWVVALTLTPAIEMAVGAFSVVDDGTPTE